MMKSVAQVCDTYTAKGKPDIAVSPQGGNKVCLHMDFYVCMYNELTMSEGTSRLAYVYNEVTVH